MFCIFYKLFFLECIGLCQNSAFYEVSKVNMVENPDMVMTLNFFAYILILRGPTIENVIHEIVLQQGIVI